MAVDKLVDSAQLDANLTAIADAIRTKGGTSASLTFPAGFVDAINAIETGGGDTMELIGSYTLTESWENDNLGNAETIWNLLKPFIEADNLGTQYNMYIALYTNNNAQNTNYKADYGYYDGNGGLNTLDFTTVRNNRTNRSAGARADRSMWASVGTVIKFYRFLPPIN